MRPYRVSVWCCALVAALSAGQAQAGWNNVFQVCCASCGGQASVAMASPVDCAQPCAPPCPQQVCTTRYIQRSYYQPVTSYRSVSYYEPVTSYRTSYYYEPVTSYRYSCYYDPCTCSYQQVAQPVTSYRLRSQCCPVTSYLQRCALQPVTTYQQMSYYEPQTTCCNTTTGAPVAAAPVTAAPVTAAPVTPAPPLAAPATQPPYVGEQRTPLTPAPGAPNVSEGREMAPPGMSDGMKYQKDRLVPQPYDSNYRQPQLGTPVPVTPTQQKPAVRMDRVTSGTNTRLKGQVVSAEQLGQANAKLLFISADPQRVQRTANADQAGHFEVTLASGGWLIYVYGQEGKPVFHQKVDVGGKETQLMKLVSR